MSVFLVAMLSGCHNAAGPNVIVKPAVFSHADEIIRKDGFAVLADRRIFTVMAFLNAAGFDEEAEGKQMHPVRVRVRKLVSDTAAKHPQKLRQWKQFYKEHPYGTFVYQDYAVSLSADFPFRRIRPDHEVGYPWALQAFSQFPDVLNDFWKTVNLESIWNDVKPAYVEEINKYDIPGMEHEMTFLWQYLRMPRKDSFVIIHIPDLLDRHNHAIGAGYENYYYNVESPGAYSYRLNIHEYLHSIANDIVKKNYIPYAEKLKGYYLAGKDKPMVKTYQEPVTFTYECMVRALDHRMSMFLKDDEKLKKRYEARVDGLSSSGLTLTGPFYQLLSDYEQSQMPFDEFVPIMFEKLPQCQEAQD